MDKEKEADIGPNHIYFPVGKIHKLEDSVDHGKAYGGQAVNTTRNKTTDYLLYQLTNLQVFPQKL